MTGLLACLFSFSTAKAADAIPTGSLTVDRTMVREGVKSQLGWNITYPAGVTEIVEIIDPQTVKPKKDCTMKVRILGASFQETVSSFLNVEFYWNKNGGTFSKIFNGTQLLVNPSTVVLNTTVKKGDKLNFGGRGYRSGAWLPLYNTGTTTPNVVVLTNGDKVPSTTPAFQQGNIETFLKPYLAADKKTISIGDKDLIVLMELGQTDPDNSGFDLQDLVTLVTFE
jgi:hypothetical protein